MDHNTHQELLPFTCTALCTPPEAPEAQMTATQSGSESDALGAALKMVRERRAKARAAPALPAFDAPAALAEWEQALTAREQALTAREQDLAKREEDFQLMCESLRQYSERQDTREKLLQQMQTVIDESNKERIFNQEKLDAQKKIQDEYMDTLTQMETSYMDTLTQMETLYTQRCAALDERQLQMETASREQETLVNAMKEALHATQEKLGRLQAAMSQGAGHEEQACAELARLRGVGLDALEAAELRELQGVVLNTARVLEGALARRAAESEVVAKQKSFMCPIGLDLMRDPVFAADGHTYDRVHIEKFFAANARQKPRSPMTNAELANADLIPNHAMRSMISSAVDAKVAEINAR